MPMRPQVDPDTPAQRRLRLEMRKAMHRLMRDNPGHFFVVIGVGPDRKPRTAHNLPEMEDAYELMRVLVKNVDEDEVTKGDPAS